jgi:predicted dehydrogenase
MDKKIRVGVLGGGFIAKAHTNGYKTIPYMFSDFGIEPVLASIVEANGELAQKASERYGYESCYADWNAMLSGADIDLVDVCLPDALHVQAAKDAIEAGKAILLEKPMSLNRQDAAMLTKLAAEKGVVNMVCFNYRFIPAVRFAYELIQKGAIGKLYHMRVGYYQEGGRNPDQLYEDTWYARPPKSGVLQGIGTHAIDQARFLMGEIVSLSAEATTHNEERKSKNGGTVKVDVEDSARAVVRFESGASGTIECSCVATGHRNGLEWEINGSKGSLKFNLEEPSYLKVYLVESVDSLVSGFTNVNVNLPGHPYMDVWWPAGHNIGWEHGHINMIAHMLECVAGKKNVAPLAATFADGCKTEAIVDCIRESSRAGKRIDMKAIYRESGLE